MQFRNIACLLLVTISFLSLTTACEGSLKLSPADDQANNHFTNAIDYNNQFIAWSNKQSNQNQPSFDEWTNSLQMLEEAIQEAKLCSSDFLQRAHPDLPTMWNTYFIPSMEKIHQYYSDAIQDISFDSAPLVEGLQLDQEWGNWFDKNREVIRANIRKMAE